MIVIKKLTRLIGRHILIEVPLRLILLVRMILSIIRNLALKIKDAVVTVFVMTIAQGQVLINLNQTFVSTPALSEII